MELNANALIEANFSRNIWRITTPIGTSPEELLKPTFWSHVALKLRPGDLIEAVAEDLAWFATLYVRSARRLDAAVSVIQFAKMDAPDVSSVAAEYRVEFRGVKAKWSILRGKEILRDGFATEAEAKVHLESHLKALAA